MILIFLIYLSERFSHPKAKITQRPQILLLGFTRQSLSHSPRPSRERERERMPGKEESSPNKEQYLELFLKIGLDERTAKNTIANNKVTANLSAVIHEVLVSFPI